MKKDSEIVTVPDIVHSRKQKGEKKKKRNNKAIYATQKTIIDYIYLVI